MKTLFALILLTHTISLVPAQEWVRQHPFAGFAPLQAITFDDQGNGWAVGQQSLILHTDNWGEIWQIQGGLPIGYTFEAVEIIPGTNAQTVLIGGPGVFITTDSGQNWSFASVPVLLDGVKRIQAFDSQTWIALGRSQGAATSDGGQSWTVFDMPDNSSNSAWYNDLNTGWASNGPFNNYTLHMTTNGGESWELADDATYPIITDIQMIDNNTGYMSARDYMYKTTNGGADWMQLHQDEQPSLTGMHVVSEDIVWSGLNNGFLFFTLDGGQNWSQINPNIINSNRIQDVFALPDGRVWAPGRYGSVQYSDDNGQTWADQTPGVKNTLFDVEFRNATGLAVGSEGAILLTTNGGAVWENIGFEQEDHYLAMTLYTGGGEAHAYLGTSRGKIIHRTLTGSQWETLAEDLGDINALYAINTQVLLAGTFRNIQRSTDGGMTWDTVETTTDFVGEFAFPNAQTGYAAIQDGRILKTTDGGASWAPVLERTAYKFSGLHFENDTDGWAVAELKDSVFITNDGGASWQSYKLPANTFWQDVMFMDADTGYISGGSSGSGTILRTTDGGLTWEWAYSETEALRRAYVRPGEDYVWVVGFGGNILHFSPCAVSPQISNLTGESEPCEGDLVIYEVESEGATVFTWTIPSGWQIIGNDNTARIEVMAGSQPGAITIRAANSCGTTTEVLSINANPRQTEDVVIVENAGVLSTTSNGITYQWYRDDVIIPGATGQNFSPAQTGAYVLEVTFSNGCTIRSNTIEFIVSGIRTIQYRPITVFPNPAIASITIGDLPDEIQEIRVYHASGALVGRIQYPDRLLDISDLSPGIYFIQAESESGMYTGRFVRL